MASRKLSCSICAGVRSVCSLARALANTMRWFSSSCTINAGTLSAGQEVLVMQGPEQTLGRAKVLQLLEFEGLERVEAAQAGVPIVLK